MAKLLDLAGLEKYTEELKAYFEKVYGGGEDDSVPSGVITLWYGSSDAVPDGWAICNGSNGTPDLRDRFVVGAGNSYATGATGGASSATATLSGNTGATTISTSTMPSHNHLIHRHVQVTTNRASGSAFQEWQDSWGYINNSYYSTNMGFNGMNTCGSGSSHTHSLSGSVDVSVLPPYYALFYIMKL